MNKNKKAAKKNVFTDKHLLLYFLAYLDANTLAFKQDKKGNISLEALADGSFPTIEISKEFKHVELTKLVKSGGISAPGAESFVSKGHKEFHGDVYLPSAKKVKINQTNLINGELDAREAKQLGIDSLRKITKDLNAGKVDKLNAGNLVRAKGNIKAKKATVANLGKLKGVDGSLDLPKAVKANIESLKSTGGHIDMSSIKKLDAPSLLDVGQYLAAGAATHVNINKTKAVGGDIYIQSAKKVHMDALQQSNDIYSSPAMAGKTFGKTTFSQEIWANDRLSLYNVNSDMVKIQGHKWTALDDAVDITAKHYSAEAFVEFYQNCEVTRMAHQKKAETKQQKKNAL